VVKGYTDRVRICRLHEVIAEHPRCWGREQQIFDPLHYLPLLERKPYCLAFGRPFELLDLPGCFEVLQRRMEWESEHSRREYIQVLRLPEHYSRASLSDDSKPVMSRTITTRQSRRRPIPAIRRRCEQKTKRHPISGGVYRPGGVIVLVRAGYQ